MPSAAVGEELGQFSLLVTDGEGRGRKISFLCPHRHMDDKVVETNSPTLSSPGPVGPCTCQEGRLCHTTQVRYRIHSLDCCNRQGAGKVLISVSDIEEWGQLCPGYCLNQGHQHRPQLRQSHRGSSSSPDITMDLGGRQATHISPFLTAFIFCDLPLFTGYEPFSLFFFHTSHYI